MDRDGSNQKQLTRGNGEDSFATCSPELKDGLLYLLGQLGLLATVTEYDPPTAPDLSIRRTHVMHHVVPYDPRYISVRRVNITSDVPMPPPPPLPPDWNKPPDLFRGRDALRTRPGGFGSDVDNVRALLLDLDGARKCAVRVHVLAAIGK